LVAMVSLIVASDKYDFESKLKYSTTL